MDNETYTQQGMDDVQIQEWLESLDSVLESSGPEVTAEILERHGVHCFRRCEPCHECPD